MQDLIDQYLSDKEDYERAKAVADEYKADVEATKAQIRSRLDELQLKSVKTDAATVSIVAKPKLVLENEAQFIAWLKEQPEVEADLYMAVNKRASETLVKDWFKQTGEQPTGTHFEASEYLAIKLRE